VNVPGQPYDPNKHDYGDPLHPLSLGRAPVVQVDLRLLRGEINLIHQVPAAAWRAGMLEESLRYE
jgi:hypothetical protein